MSPARAGESSTQSTGAVSMCSDTAKNASCGSECGNCRCRSAPAGGIAAAAAAAAASAPGAAAGEVLASAADSVPHPRILTSRPEMPTDESSSGRSSATSSSSLSIWERLIAGGMAGALSKTVIAPADRVKILYQVNRDRRFSLASAAKTFKKIVEHRGVRGLWTGNSAQIVRIVPYAATGYLSFDAYQSLLLRSNLFAPLFGRDSAPEPTDSEKITIRFIAGALAGATATALTYPLDLVRSRMANQWASYEVYPTVSKAARKIYAEEGASALVHGMKPTLLGIVPYAGLSFMTFETLKSRIRQRQSANPPSEGDVGVDAEQVGRLPHVQAEEDIPIGLRLMAGGVAGLVAQSATYPLDIVRRRMQVGIPYQSITHAFREIIKSEGFVNGMYKGLVMNWFKGPVAVGVSFVTNDLVKNYFVRRHREHNDEEF